MLDASQIAPTEVTTAIPSTFAPNAWSVGIGELTSTVEGWFGTTTPATNSATAAVSAQAPNGTPSAPVAGGSTLLGFADALSNPLSLAFSTGSAVGTSAASVSADAVGVFQNIGGGVTSAANGLVSLTHWIVVGLIAVAAIYVLAQMRVLEGVL